MGAAVSIQSLTFTYHGMNRPALRNIEGEIEEGKLIAIMGHGGAGKSTLCYCLNGIVPKFFRGNYEGLVLIYGEEVKGKKVSEMSRLVGLVLQDFEAQLFSTNVELEMAFGPENLGLPRSEIEDRIHRYLTLVGLENLRERQPSSLSGGQKQRLAIGSVLAIEPKILVMDEPTTDLDPQGREEVLSIGEHLRGEGRTLILVDHNPEYALRADQLWLMREGEVVAKGLPKEILIETTTLESCGIRPLPTLELFQKMKWQGMPLDAQSAMALIEKHHLIERRKLRSKVLLQEDSGMAPFIRVEGLRYVYPFFHIEALRGIDLSIREGEFIALLGQNGSGKTTLAKHLNGLLKPTLGKVFIKGKSTLEYTRHELASLVGYVFQNPDHQIFCKTVKEEVGFGLKLLGEDPKRINDRVAEALDTVGLGGYEEKNPFTLTKGERQRIAVASVLATRPQVIILDEPTTGLDYHSQRNMMEMLKHLNRKGHTIIIITHSMWVACEYARRVILLKEGSIAADGPTREVFADENLLSQTSLRPPPLVQLSNWLGTKALTVEEMVQELREESECLNL